MSMKRSTKLKEMNNLDKKEGALYKSAPGHEGVGR